MRIKQLSKRDIREFINILESFGVKLFRKTKRGCIADLGKGRLIYINDFPVLVDFNNIIVPFIDIIPKCTIKKIYVDEGAVRPIINGADVMAPGIIKFNDFHKGDVIAVLIDKYNSPIAVGIALIDSNELVNMRKGRVIKNLHHLMDVFWKYVKGK